MSSSARGRRWTGWASRNPSLIRPFPTLRIEELESRLAPATFTWDGGGGDNKWSNPNNWQGDMLPSVLGGDELVFPALPAGVPASQKTNVNDFDGASFRAITISDEGYALSGKPLSLGNSGPGSTIFTVNPGVSGSLGNSISFDITLAAAAGTDQTIIVNANSELTLSGKVSGATGSSLNKDGPGVLRLAGDNSGFTGPIKVNNAGGYLEVTHPLALGTSADINEEATTVGSGATLRVAHAAGMTVGERVRLNGLGVSNAGALLNEAGNNTWTGSVILDTFDTAIGANAGSLNITGTVSDLVPNNLVKEGVGEVRLNPASAAGNTYRGQTKVNNGTLTVNHRLGLGAAGTEASGTIVRERLTDAGQLRIADLDPADGNGFTILNEQLTLNGDGLTGLGALYNAVGFNTWAGPVILGSPAPTVVGFATAGVAGATELVVSGVVSSPNQAYQLRKVDAGRLIFNNGNTYTGHTWVLQGMLNIRDSRGLGSTVSGTEVEPGAALELEVDAGFDAQGRPLGTDSVLLADPNRLLISESLVIGGRGVNNTGALRSISGINRYVAGIFLADDAAEDAIGVDLDQRPGHPTPTANYFTDDYSLTVESTISGGNSFGGPALVKRNAGHLILTNQNTYRGVTRIEQGWVTVQHSLALGGAITLVDTPIGNGAFGAGASVQPGTFVSAGASLHLKPLASGGSLDIFEHLTLAGTGPAHPYSFISENGAILNIAGTNRWTGDVSLNPGSGIGAEYVPYVPLPAGTPPTSELTFTGQFKDVAGVAGGLVKLGSRRVNLQGDGTFSGGNEVREGALRVQNDTALGRASSGTFTTQQTYTQTNTTVAPGGVLEFATGVATLNGGVASGVQVWDEQLTLNGQAQHLSVAGVALPAPASFTLSFNGQTTAPIFTGASATDVATALNRLTTVGVAEVQAVTVTGTSGTFTLTFNGQSTAALPFNATAAQVRTALNGLPGVAAVGGNFTVTKTGTVFTVTFDGGLRGANHPQLVATGVGGVTAGSATVTDGTPGVDVVEALNGTATRYRITFVNHLANADQPQVTTDSLDSAGNPAATTVTEGGASQSEVQAVDVVQSTAGYTLTWGGQTTPLIRLTATAEQLKSVIEASLTNLMSAAGSIGVTRSGGVFTIVFGNTGTQNIAPLVPTPTAFAEALVSGGDAAVVNVSNDNAWRGPVSLAAGSRVDVTHNSRLSLLGPVGDAANPNVVGSDLGKRGLGELLLGGQNAYRGTTWIDVGVLSAMHSLAFGATSGGTVVGEGAQLQLQGSITVAGEPLTLVGSGQSANTYTLTLTGTPNGTYRLAVDGNPTAPIPATATPAQVQSALESVVGVGVGNVAVSYHTGGYLITFGRAFFRDTVVLTGSTVSGTVPNVQAFTTPTFPARWFNTGPAPTNNGLPATNQNLPTAARVTSVAVDPSDRLNVMYVATAGGGAWKTKNGGKTWDPLFDRTGADANAALYGGWIAVSPSNPNVIYFATGDPNGRPTGSPIPGQQDNYAGTGVYRSSNGGTTWTLLTNSDGTNPLYGQEVTKLIVDPSDPNLIYVSSGTTNTINVPDAVPGVWRHNGSWLNLTAQVSANRQNVPRNAPFNEAGGGPPRNAGPDDDYRLIYPQKNATWSDIVLVNGVLYAALGESTQQFASDSNRNQQGVFNSVYRFMNPRATNGSERQSFGGPLPGQGWEPDGRNTTFPLGPITPPQPPYPLPEVQHPLMQVGRNGWIRLGGAVDTGPAPDVYHVYALVGYPEWHVRHGEVQDIQRVQWDTNQQTGFGWTTVAAPVGLFGTASSQPGLTNRIRTTNTIPGTARYNAAIVVDDVNPFDQIEDSHTRLYIAGQDAIYSSADSGGNWAAITPGQNGSSPARQYHALHLDPGRRLLTASDGGLWAWSGTFGSTPASETFVNLNGDLAAARLHAADPHPTDPTRALAGAQDTGLQVFNNSTAWTRTGDDNGFNAGAVRYDPINPQTAYAVRDGILFKSTNGGATWTPLRNVTNTLPLAPGAAGNTPVVPPGSATNQLPLVVDPINPSRVLIGGPNLQESSNGGASFTNLIGSRTGVDAIALATYQGPFVPDTGFPNVTDRLANTYDPDTIYVSATPRGAVFRLFNITGDYFLSVSGSLNGTFFSGTTVVLNPGMSPGLIQGALEQAITTATNGFAGYGDVSVMSVGTNVYTITFYNEMAGATVSLFPTTFADVALITPGGDSRLLVTKDHGVSWQTRTPQTAGMVFAVTYGGALDRGDQPQLTATAIDGASVTVGTTRDGSTTAAEIQTLNVVGQAGSFTLTVSNGFGTQTSAPIFLNSLTLQTDIQNALNALDPIADATRQEVQTVAVNGTSGDFTLGYNGVFTGALPFNVAASTMQAQLNGLSSMIAEGRTVTVTGPVSGVYTVTFSSGSSNARDVNQLVRTENGPTVTVATQLQGADSGSVAVGPGSSGPSAIITDVTVDPSNRDTVYATFRYANGQAGYTVMRSTDAGQTWVDIAGRITGSTLPRVQTWKAVVDPRDGTLYVGNDDGVYALANARTADPAALTWARFGAGMPRVQVRDLVLNQQLNTLTAATYGRGMFQLFLPNYQQSSGALRSVSGSAVWTGDVTLTGPTTFGAAGTQAIQNGIAAASLNVVGDIKDAGATPNEVVKVGLGTVTFSGENTYKGKTTVLEGVLQANNETALGDDDGITVVTDGAALELRSSLRRETVELNGNGIPFNQHNTGALRNVSNDNTFTGTLVLNTDSTIGVDSGTTLTIGELPAFPGEVGTLTDLGATRDYVKELTGTLILASANSNDGLVTVYQGAVRAQHAVALGAGGSAANATRVLDGAAVEIAANGAAPTVVADERLFLSGTGLNAIDGVGTGALWNVSGSNEWNGRVTLNIDPNSFPPTNPRSQIAFGVTNAGDTLTIGGVIDQDDSAFNATPGEPAGADASMGVIKVGGGRLALSNANQYTGVTDVREGAVQARNDTALGSPAPSPEVQTLAVVGILGSYRLNFGGQLTSFLGATANAAQVQAALESLANIPAGGVLVTETPSVGGKVFNVTFRGSLAGADQPQITAVSVSAGLAVNVGTAQTGGLGTVVLAGAALELDGSAAALTVAEVLHLNGDGAGGTGALRNVAGGNTYSGPVTLVSDTAIGADASTTLTVSGTVRDPGGATPLVNVARLKKVGTGTVVFPNANTYGGRTEVAEGVLGVGHAEALGQLRDEVQVVTVVGTNGSFNLGFNNQTSAFLPYDADAVLVGGALNGLLGAGTPEIQTITVTGVAGTFTVTFAGDTTDPLPFDATAQQVEDALNALNSIALVGAAVDVTKSGGTYTVEFLGTRRYANQPQMAAAGSGGTIATTAASQDGSGDIVVSTVVDSTTNTFTHTVTFTGALRNRDVDQITASTFGGTVVTVVTTTDGSEGTTVQGGATLQLQGGITMSQEYLTINGEGFGGIGALSGAGGTNVLAVLPVTLGSDAAVGATAGSALEFLVPLTEATAGLNVAVTDAGTTRFSATGDNQYTGTTTVRSGTLELNHSGAGTHDAVRGPLTVGDGTGPAGSAVARNLRPDQIADGQPVTVNADGTYALNGQTEVVGRLTVVGGLATTGSGSVVPVVGGQLTADGIDLTAGRVNIADLSARVVLTNNVTSSAAAVPAEIDGPGALDLNGADRTFAVADGAAVEDLVVSAEVAGSGGVVKTGPGRLALDGDNTFTGPLTVQAGDAQVGGSVGDVVLDGGTLSGTGTTDALTGPGGAPVPNANQVSPGDNGVPATEVGSLTAASATWGTGTTFFIHLNGDGLPGLLPLSGGTHHDQLRLTGDIELGGALLTGVFGTGIELGDRFRIVETTGAVTGEFAEPFNDDDNEVFIQGQKFDVEYGPNYVDLVKVLAEVDIAVASNANPSTYKQDLTFTATITPEDGATAPIGPSDITFQFDRIGQPPPAVPPSPDVSVTYTAPAVQGANTFDPETQADAGSTNPIVGPHVPGGTYTLGVSFTGDGINFDSKTAALAPNQVVEVPYVDDLTVTATHISPDNSPGVLDSTTVSTTARDARAAGAATPTWTVTVTPAAGGPAVRTISGVGVVDVNTFPVSAVWDGKDDAGNFVADGDYRVAATIQDLYGNTDTTPDVLVVVDNTSPALTDLASDVPVIAPGTAAPPAPAPDVPNDAVLSATVTDATAVGWAVEVRDAGGTVVRTITGTGANVSVTWDGRNDLGAIVPDGEYAATLTVTDAAGNVTASNAAAVVVLTTGPSVSLTSNSPTGYGEDVHLTATVSVPFASVAGLLVGTTVDFYNDTTLLGSSTVSFVAGQYQATLTVPTFAVGVHPNITAEFVGSTHFLPSTSPAITHEVTKPVLYVTAVDQTKVYGAPLPPLTYTVTGVLLPGDDYEDVLSGSVATAATQASHVGTYAITQGTLTQDPDYILDFTEGTLTITPAALTVSADAKTKVYGAPLPPLTYTVSGLVNNDTEADVLTGDIVTDATQASHVGEYDITQGTLAVVNGANGLPNYTMTFVAADLEVTPAQLTVTAAGKTKVYGAPLPPLTFTAVGLVNGDTPETAIAGGLATTATQASPVGAYPITQGSLVASGNYTLTFEGSTLTVTPAPLTVTATSLTKVYGAPMPPLTYTVAGLTNGDTEAGVLTGAIVTPATGASPVGVYAIAQGSLAANANYALTFVSGILSVTPAPLTVTANDQTKPYGAPVPPLTYVVSGLVNGDVASGVVAGTLESATQTSPVGAYPISRGNLAANANYAMTFVPGTLTVTAVPLTITIDNKQRLFNTENPPLTATFTGLVLGETPAVVSGLALATTAAKESPPGSYPIFSTGVPTAPNYTVTLVPGVLDVVQLRPREILAIPARIGLGSGAGGPARVHELQVDGLVNRPLVSDVDPVVPSFTGSGGGIRTAAADFDGDGMTDYVLGTGPGAVTQVVIINGKTRAELFRVQPFETSFTGGVYVAAGDVTGDGVPDLMISPDEGGGPRVRVFDGNSYAQLADFYGINDPNFRGGARPAVGDVDHDGFGDLAVAAGFGGGPRVAVFSGKKVVAEGQLPGDQLTPDRIETWKLFGDLLVFEAGLRNGTFVSIGDVNGDTLADLVVGAGPGGGPRVVALSGAGLLAGEQTRLADFFAGDVNNRGGVRVTVKDLDDDNRGDLVVGAGDGAGAIVTAYRGADLGQANPPKLFETLAFADNLNGVYVG